MREADETIQELFIALTARWRRQDGDLAIGVTKSKLLKAIGSDTATLDSFLAQIKEKISLLGMEIVEYIYDGEVWYAVRSTYACPSELKSEEEAVLATVISGLEETPGSAPQIPPDFLKKRLVDAKYFSEYQIDRILKSLELFAYIKRKGKNIGYGPRSLLEFSLETRKHIAMEAKRFIL